ncbi:MAG: cytochrome c oxidase assembly protein PET191-domain-containing protein, partial [Olpidium bornovanus]
ETKRPPHDDRTTERPHDRGQRASERTTRARTRPRAPPGGPPSGKFSPPVASPLPRAPERAPPFLEPAGGEGGDLFEVCMASVSARARREAQNRRALAAPDLRSFRKRRELFNEDMPSSCQDLRFEIIRCVNKSDCMKIYGREFHDCLSRKRVYELPQECHAVLYALFECKRSMVSMGGNRRTFSFGRFFLGNTSHPQPARPPPPSLARLRKMAAPLVFSGFVLMTFRVPPHPFPATLFPRLFPGCIPVPFSPVARHAETFPAHLRSCADTVLGGGQTVHNVSLGALVARPSWLQSCSLIPVARNAEIVPTRLRARAETALGGEQTVYNVCVRSPGRPSLKKTELLALNLFPDAGENPKKCGRGRGTAGTTRGRPRPTRRVVFPQRVALFPILAPTLFSIWPG